MSDAHDSNMSSEGHSSDAEFVDLDLNVPLSQSAMTADYQKVSSCYFELKLYKANWQWIQADKNL